MVSKIEQTGTSSCYLLERSLLDLRTAISVRILAISFLRALTEPEVSSLTRAQHFIFLARSANLRVLMVSRICYDASLTAAIIKVRELPPKESLSMNVSLLSR